MTRVNRGPRMDLRALRLEAGFTREQLAVYAGISSRTVLRAELGQVTPTTGTLRLLADALGCEPGDLRNDERRPATGAAVKESVEQDRHDPE